MGQPGSGTGIVKGLVGRAAMTGTKTLLRWLLGLVGIPAAVAMVAALLGVMTVLAAFAEGSREDLQAAAREAAAEYSGEVRSFDGAERAHALPPGLVAAVVQQAEVEGRRVEHREAAAALAPRFTYQTYTLRTVRREPTSETGGTEPAWQEVVETRSVTALTVAETYRGTFTYRYRVRRVDIENGYREELERTGVEFTPVPERLAQILSGLLDRPVEQWEAAWVEGLAGDLSDGGDAPGGWLLAMAPDEPGSGGWSWRSTWSGMAAGDRVVPVEGPITSEFGWRVHPLYGTPHFHAGVDIGAPAGTPVRAALSGQVQFAGAAGGYGLAVILDHGGGIHTLYGHMRVIRVRAGQEVAAGETLGEVGSTGLSTGPHLHFEVRRDGKPVDPLEWLAGR